jgi:hypothetical protein
VHKSRDDVIQVGIIGVVRDGHSSVPKSFESSNKLGRDKGTVAEKRMSMQINHLYADQSSLLSTP